jgi:hypothetical protein
MLSLYTSGVSKNVPAFVFAALAFAFGWALLAGWL